MDYFLGVWNPSFVEVDELSLRAADEKLDGAGHKVALSWEAGKFLLIKLDLHVVEVSAKWENLKRTIKRRGDYRYFLLHVDLTDLCLVLVVNFDDWASFRLQNDDFAGRGANDNVVG